MRFNLYSFKNPLVLAALFILATFLFYQTVFADTEVIKNFDSNIAIQNSGILFIKETITYDFGSNQKHGIFRTIPLETSNGPTIDLSVQSVTDENGTSYIFTDSYEGGNFEIKIGDPSKLVTGIKIYVISYSVQSAIRSFADYDELYWNVNGNEWPVAIQNVKASVSFPQEFFINEIKSECFSGSLGSTEKTCILDYYKSSSNSVTSGVSFSASKMLNPREGLTIVAGFPIGIVAKTTQIAPIIHKNSNIIPIALGLFVLLIIASIFRTFFHKNKPNIPPELRNRSIIAEYNPPEHLMPTDVGVIFDGNLDNVDLSSVIIDLAVKGYLKIKYRSNRDYEFIKLKDLSGFDHPAYKIIFNFLFVSQNTVKLSELENSRASFDSDRIMVEMQKYLENSGYLKDVNEKDPAVKKYYFSRYIAIILSIFGILFIALFVGYGGFKDLGLGGVFGLVFACGGFAMVVGLFVIIIVFGKPIFSRLSPLGVTGLATILGFKEFLEITETDRIKFLNAPELNPELFDHYLPYAMVLGVEKEWAKKFDSIYNISPSWFEGPSGTFGATALVGHLSNFGNSFNNSTRSSSSSGFSGGHSGGGSGGGGGGSW